MEMRNIAYCEEDQSANKGQYPRDGEEPKTLIDEDLSETKEVEEEECGLCRYIKGGECKEAFIQLQKCEDEECKDAKIKFKTCMYENPVYYEPFFRELEGQEEEKAE